jgi:hypothetical protein
MSRPDGATHQLAPLGYRLNQPARRACFFQPIVDDNRGQPNALTSSVACIGGGGI